MEVHTRVDTQDIRMLTQAAIKQPESHRSAQYVTPVSPCSNWTTVNTSASSVDANLLTPGTTVASRHRLIPAGQGGTSLLVRMRYPIASPTPCTVRLFGFDGSHIDNAGKPEVADLTQNVRPKPQQLPDETGALTTTLTPAAGTDPQDQNSFAYTKAVRFDMLGNIEILCLVSSAGPANSTIEVRVI